MAHSFRSYFILIISILVVSEASCLLGQPSNEHTLYDAIFANYSKSLRPVKHWNQTLRVDILVEVNKIAQVVEQNQAMKLRVRMELRWLDAYLHWNPKDHNGIESLVLPASLLWVPDLHLFNSVAEDELLYPQNVELYSNGSVVSYPISSLNAHCDFNFARFPFDSQTCRFQIGSMLDKVTVVLRAYCHEQLSNPEWLLSSVSAGSTHPFLIPGTIHHSQEAFTYDWSVASFNVVIRRASPFYVHLFIWPLVLLLILGGSVFILPPSCVERVSVGVLLLLALTVLSLTLETFSPRAANPSIIAKLVSFDMFMLTLATVLSTLIVSVDKENFLMVRKVPQWTKNLLMSHLGKVAFKQETLLAMFSNETLIGEEIRTIDTTQILAASGQEESEPRVSGTSEEASKEQDLVQAKALLTLINNQVANERKRLQQDELRQRNRDEWYTIATVLDRLCLLGYAVIGLLGLLIVLV